MCSSDLEFVVDADIPDGLAVRRGRDNVVVMRTLSKAYGLAGLRVGFATGHPYLVEGMRKTALPFGVSNVAHDAALAALDCEEELLGRVHWLIGERDRVWSALIDQGWPLHPSHANFIWIRLGDLTSDFAHACESAGVTIRAFPGEGVRISIAEQEANDRIIEVAGGFNSALR